MKLKIFEITFRTVGSKNKIVHGLFQSSFDAHMATLTAIGELCYVKVKVL